ncbi:MAG: hypothetical protein KDD04_02570, partial [Sinomicrobium sp.]|nr:hypothetical protein [Sinomicrobium sp.]
MKKIEKLYYRLKNQTAFEKRYPIFKEDDGKIHLLFISAPLSRAGYYRVIAPALELGRTGSHAAIISNIHKQDFTRPFGHYDSPVDEQLIRWAHYIVLPAMLTDAAYILKALKAKNNDVQFVMDLDSNLHAIPKQHPYYLKITQEQKKQLLANIARMNIITGSSEGMLRYYDDLLNRHYPDAGVYMEYLPDLVSSLAYRHLPTPIGHETIRLRIGIITSGGAAYDVLSIRSVLK